MVPMTLIDLHRPASWPTDLRSYLDARHDLFLGWERGNVAAPAYDEAIYGLIDVLQPYAITGWHCTRLTDAEIDQIARDGMQLPNTALLDRRIDALVASGELVPEIAVRLKATNQSGDANRAGMVWFCFFHPRLAGESGIERFFRHWGGEALYNSHERDPITSPAISVIGKPCVIEADIPIASLGKHGGLSFKIVRRFLKRRGFRTREPVDHEDRIRKPLPAENIRRIVCFSEADFSSLTGCAEWRQPLRAANRVPTRR
ncbi:MAG: hypothetical protein AB7U97_09730 [Pirellulales bacterium]